MGLRGDDCQAGLRVGPGGATATANLPRRPGVHRRPAGPSRYMTDGKGASAGWTSASRVIQAMFVEARVGDNALLPAVRWGSFAVLALPA